jgi:putative colanic acid biosynthesis acetyltransferase WcaF
VPLDPSESGILTASNSRTLLVAYQITPRDRARRALWNLTWRLLAKPTPRVLHTWRLSLAKLFGARIGPAAHIYPGAKIWAPWNLVMGARSCLADGVACYNVAPIHIGEDVVISQHAYLCTATHDYNDRAFPLVVAPIVIEPYAWVAAGAFLSPGITVERGAVVGARSVVTASVPAWSVVAGNPAKFIKFRVNFDSSQT